MRKFVFLRKFSKEICCFLEEFIDLEKNYGPPVSANFKSELRHNRLQSAPQINANNSQHSANHINLNHKTVEPSPYKYGLQAASWLW